MTPPFNICLRDQDRSMAGEGGRAATAWRARAWRRLILGLFLLCLLGPISRADDAAPSEYQVKAVWLLNFARFVEWPAAAFPNPRTPFIVGVVGKDPFGKDLDRAFEGKTFKGRAFAIKRISTEQECQGCHILFVSSSERRRMRDLREKLKSAPVLTVGESEDFLDQGGTINFLLKDNSVRFEINLKAAQAAELRLHANLLKVAVAVRGKYD